MNSLLVESVFTTPWGSLKVVHNEQFILNTLFTDETKSIAQHPLSKQIVSELDAYISNPHHQFQLPLQPYGTPYQLKIWQALLLIPPGLPCTYGHLAASLQSGPRAVGQACKRNPIALFIPCHRVVGQSSLGGYMGNKAAVPYKEALLRHENYTLVRR